MPFYRKKPVVITADKLTKENTDELCLMVNGALRCESRGGEMVVGIVIPTLEGPMFAPEGWYIIQGVKGEYYACEPEIFELTYEAL